MENIDTLHQIIGQLYTQLFAYSKNLTQLQDMYQKLQQDYLELQNRTKDVGPGTDTKNSI